MSLFREHIVKRLKRSRGWSKVRKKYVRDNPYCECCGRTKRPEVHHVKDFSSFPELELEPSNLITLCAKRCHFMMGHLLDYKSINPHIVIDSQWFLKKVRSRR